MFLTTDLCLYKLYWFYPAPKSIGAGRTIIFKIISLNKDKDILYLQAFFIKEITP